MKKWYLSILATMSCAGVFSLGDIACAADDSINMYRLYNNNSGEHFYTASAAERNHLTSIGWKYEGVGWAAPKTGEPVYRMYNASAGDHHYTTNSAEKDNLVKSGWKYEGIGWYSSASKEVALYRAYNSNARAGSHNYTTNGSEQAMLLKAGWKDEGIAWYGISGGAAEYFIGTIEYKDLNENDDVQKSAKYLGSRIVDDGATVNFYPITSGMIQSINGYYQGYVSKEFIDECQKTLKEASLHSGGKSIALYSHQDPEFREKIMTAQNGQIIYLK